MHHRALICRISSRQIRRPKAHPQKRSISDAALGDISTWDLDKIIHFFNYHPINSFATSVGDVDAITKKYFRYELIYQSKKSKARVGKIITPHGEIDTPGFVPVATTGALKYVDPVFADRQLGTQLMFCNTYHLIVHPGADAVAAAGGIHQFNKYSKPIITDSGGFQVFSLGNTEAQDELKGKVISKSRKLNQGGGSSIVRLNEQGVLFRSYLNGDLIELSPETSVEAQKKFQSDIIVPLDILLPNATTEKRRMASLHRTHRWEARSLVTHLQNLNNQAMYCVLHGGTDRTMRTLSAKYLLKLPFQGVAIGGSLGKNREEMIQVVSLLSDMIPKDKPVHLLGIGDVRGIQEAIPYGIDTFDSVYPTRSGRHGQFFSGNGEVSIGKKEHATRTNSGVVEGCQCPTCSTHSAAYVHHLFRMREPLGMTLGTVHNLHFMMQKMAKFRQDILDGNV